MYEVETKVELTLSEKQKLLEVFRAQNFAFRGMTPQNDFYIETKESPHGGFDLKRYRHEGDEYIYTEKVWELIEGRPFRKEDQHEVSKEQFESAVAEFPHALAIKKDRESFDGLYQETPISLTIDSVKFDHSPKTRYFLEAEILVEDKNAVVATKELIAEFLREILDKSEIVESPGMFTMGFKKL
jgi:adenylate cyclase class IV